MDWNTVKIYHCFCRTHDQVVLAQLVWQSEETHELDSSDFVGTLWVDGRSPWCPLVSPCPRTSSARMVYLSHAGLKKTGNRQVLP